MSPPERATVRLRREMQYGYLVLMMLATIPALRSCPASRREAEQPEPGEQERVGLRLGDRRHDTGVDDAQAHQVGAVVVDDVVGRTRATSTSSK
jgi:hypothetical protein